MTTPNASALAELERESTTLIAEFRRCCEEWGSTLSEPWLDRVNTAEEALFAHITSLLALASSGAADGELLDGLLDDALTGMREPMTLADARDVRDMLTRVHVARKKARVRAARSLPPSAPSDDTPQQDQPQKQEG